MPRYSLSLGYFFTHVPLVERLQKAVAAGFHAVEMFWPAQVDSGDLERARAQANVEVVLFNMNEGDYRAGDRGFACVPDRLPWWRAELSRALLLADKIDCRRINVLAGKIPDQASRTRFLDCFVENLRWAAPQAAAAGVQLVVEPLNHLSHPDGLCQRTVDVIEVLDLVMEPNVGLQYDVYHAQRSEGNIIDTIREHIGRIMHVQIADVPTRSCPGSGELNFPAILATLDALNYKGYVGLEYIPPHPPVDPFGWLRQLSRE